MIRIFIFTVCIVFTMLLLAPIFILFGPFFKLSPAYGPAISDDALIGFVAERKVEIERIAKRIPEGTVLGINKNDVRQGDIQPENSLIELPDIQKVFDPVGTVSITSLGTYKAGSQLWWFSTEPSREYHPPFLAEKTLYYRPEEANQSLEVFCSAPDMAVICNDTLKNLTDSAKAEELYSIQRYIGNGWYISLRYLDENIP